MSVFIK